MKYTCKWYWLRWRLSFYELIYGLCGVFTLGAFKPDIDLQVLNDFMTHDEYLYFKDGEHTLNENENR